MKVVRCKGCSKTFINERAFSSHLQHKTICKSIHYNFDIQTVIINWKQPKTVTNKASKSNLGDIDNRQKTSETNIAKQNNSENGFILEETDIDVSKLNFNTDNCKLSFSYSSDSNLDKNDSSEPAENSTAISSSDELFINGFIY